MSDNAALEADLARLKQLGASVRDGAGVAQEAAVNQIRTALASRSSAVAAAAGRLAGEHTLPELVPDLARAFGRFMKNPLKTDPGCMAKTAIAEALYKIGATEVDLFRAGLRHVQMEPVWGGRVDTATDVRGWCAMALASIPVPDIFYELVELLVDPEHTARRFAILALASLEGERSELLLRQKALTGDKEPEVLSECLTALMRLDPEGSLAFVARWLDGENPTLAEVAALAIGASHAPGAFSRLREAWERAMGDGARRLALLVPIALLRSDESFDFLLEIIEAADEKTAAAAVAAAGQFHESAAAQGKIRAAQRRR